MRLKLYCTTILVFSLLTSSPALTQEIREGADNTTKFANNIRAAVLAFGTRPDATAWAEGIGSITGSKDVTVIRDQFPTMEELVEFFKQEPEWLFIGGHFDGSMLTNGVVEERPDLNRVVITIYFYPKSIVINRGAEQKTLIKGEDFALHTNLKYIFWGGCSSHDVDAKTSNLLNIFSTKDSRPVSLGWTNRTGYQVSYAILGGYGNEEPFASRDFFDRLQQIKLRQPLTDRDVIESWMQTSIDTYWGLKYPIDDSVSVIDSYGDEWVIQDARIVKSVVPWADLTRDGAVERRIIREQQRELAKLASETQDTEVAIEEVRSSP